MKSHVRRPLDRAQVLAAALTLVDEQGSSALTMRTLARALGVEAMSLYHHVRNREDLLDGLAETMVAAELPTPGADQAWDDALRAFAVAIRRAALRHPAAFRLVGLRPLRSRPALAAVSGLLTCLHRGGLDKDSAVAAYRLAAAFARGFALAEIAGLTLGDRRARPDELVSELSPFAPALERDSAQVFDQSLSLLLAGVAARLAEPGGDAQRPSGRSGRPQRGRPTG